MTKSNRKLLLEIKGETAKLRAGLNTLRKMPQKPRTAAAWTHLANITQCSEELCKASKLNLLTTLSTNLRSLAECAINCSLTLSYYSDEALILLGLEEKRKLNNKIINDTTGEFSTQNKKDAEANKELIEERINAIQAIANLNLPSDLKIERKFQLAGQEDFYKLHYTIFSASVHSSLTELSKRHIAEGEEPQLIWYSPASTEINIYLVCLQDIINYSWNLYEELASKLNSLTQKKSA